VIHSQGGQGLPNADKFARAIDRIDAQVSRGAAFLENLNRFAHCLDRDQDEIDLNQEAQQTAFLCQRLARRGRHEIQVQSADQAVPAGVDPLWLQIALYAAVECCLDQLPEASKLTICTTRREDRPSLEFVAEAGQEASPPLATGTPSWRQLLELLGRVGASIEASDTERRLTITLPSPGAA